MQYLIPQYLKSLEIADIIFPGEESSPWSDKPMTPSHRLRVNTLCMIYNIGLAYKSCSEATKAIHYHRTCINTFQNYYGNVPHVALAGYIDNLGCAYHSNKAYEAAIKCFRKALWMKATLCSPLAIVGQSVYNRAISTLALGKDYKGQGTDKQSS